MSDRLAIIDYHEGVEKVVSFKAAITDAQILEHMKLSFGPLHRIKRVRICEITAEYSNVTPIETWLKTTEKLTK